MSQQQSRSDLEQRVDELEAENQELKALVEAAFKRIENLEEENESPSVDSAALDHYDAAVIEQLDDGQKLTVGALRELYQTHTRIRSGSKIKSRIKALTNQPEFLGSGPGWVYRPNGADRDE